MLVFMQPSCSTCSVIAPALRAAARQERGEVEVVLASLSTDQQMNDAFIEAEKLDELTFLASDALAHAYKVTMPPYAVVVGTDGTVKTKGVVNNREHLESLLVATKLGHPTRHVPAALKQAAV
jgi:methylamine dehydrogenase accessory protein MauD